MIDALLFVEFVLVGFLNLGFAQVETEQVDKLVVALGASEVYGIEIGFEDAMDSCAILHRCSRLGRQAPVAIEFEL